MGEMHIVQDKKLQKLIYLQTGMLPRSRKSRMTNTLAAVPCRRCFVSFVLGVAKAEYKTELERLRVELERLSPNLKAVDQLQGVAEHVQAGPAGRDLWGVETLS